MNEVINTILNRRSVRAFKPDMPEKSALDAIIKCGVYAPSAMNTQNWHFTLIKNAGLISRINEGVGIFLSEAMRERMLSRSSNGKVDVFYNAPVIIMVSTPNGEIVNGAIATENMCVAAESLGLGTCIIGMAAMLFATPYGDKYLKEMQIPEGYKPIHAICVGYKNMESQAPERQPGKVTVIE